jgi:hypothetical protein
MTTQSAHKDREAFKVACEVFVEVLMRLPRTPTPAMVAAGTKAHADSPCFEAQRIIAIWQAMYDIAMPPRSLP